MDESLATRLQLVLDDVRRTTTLEPQIDDDDWFGEPGTVSAMIGFRDITGRSGIILREPDARGVAQIADKVQEEVIEALWERGESAVWPECPDHPASHPLSATASDGTAQWICPKTHRSITPVGSLGVP